jgi:hypothetical protein
MCPDPQILSLYIDGELPSPWKEKLEAHIGSCAGCRIRLERYGGIRSALAADGAAAAQRAKDRVWAGLAVSEREPPGLTGFRLIKKSGPPAWNRTVSVPLPAAAAAAAFIVTAFVILLSLRQPAGVPAQEPVSSVVGTDVQGIIPVTDMNGVLQYLSAQETSDYLIIRLPESRNFSSSGDPALLKAADYAGRSVTSR